jgi:hypothetical protein
MEAVIVGVPEGVGEGETDAVVEAVDVGVAGGVGVSEGEGVLLELANPLML